MVPLLLSCLTAVFTEKGRRKYSLCLIRGLFHLENVAFTNLPHSYCQIVVDEIMSLIHRSFLENMDCSLFPVKSKSVTLLYFFPLNAASPTCICAEEALTYSSRS